jgi:hypothetical protein
MALISPYTNKPFIVPIRWTSTTLANDVKVVKKAITSKFRFHKKNVTKCLGHHYAIWTQKKIILASRPSFQTLIILNLYTDSTFNFSFLICKYKGITCDEMGIILSRISLVAGA